MLSAFKPETDTNHTQVRVVASFLNVGPDFLNNFLLFLLAVRLLSGIHFVKTNNKVFHTQFVNQKGMLLGPLILDDTSFKFTNTRNNNQDSTGSLRCA
jgi:hypothetical protein